MSETRSFSFSRTSHPAQSKNNKTNPIPPNPLSNFEIHYLFSPFPRGEGGRGVRSLGLGLFEGIPKKTKMLNITKRTHFLAFSSQIWGYGSLHNRKTWCNLTLCTTPPF